MTGGDDADNGRSDCDSTGETYRRRVDFGETDPHRAVVDVVAAVADVGPTDLGPLYQVIDPEALDAVVSADGAASADLVVVFTYNDHRVRIDANGLIEVRLPADPDDRR